MSYDFKKLMAEKSDVDLVRVLAGGADEYAPEALKAAEEEFAKRNISEATLNNAKEIYGAYKVRESKKVSAGSTTVGVILWIKIGTILLFLLGAIITWILNS